MLCRSRLVVVVAALLLVSACSTTPESAAPSAPTLVSPSDDAIHWTMCRMQSFREQDTATVEVWFGAWEPSEPVAGATRLHLVPPVDSEVVEAFDTAGVQSALQADQTQLTTRWAQDGDQVTEWNWLQGEHAVELDEWTAAPLIDLRPFAERGPLLEALGLTDESEARHHDHFGPYERWTALPPDLPRGRSVLATLADYMSVPIAVDLWAADDGRVQRVRFTTLDLDLRYVEIQLGIDAVSDDASFGDVGCPDDFASGGTDSWAGYEPWQTELQVPLEVSFDHEGRPYEQLRTDGITIGQEDLGQFVSPGGGLLVMDGSVVMCCLEFTADPAESNAVDFGPDVERFDVTRITSEWDGNVETLGLRFDLPGTEVARWSPFETAYGTDGGQGAVMAPAAARWVEKNPPEVQMMDEPGEWQRLVVRDIDDVAGTDLIVFSNGWGDGAFPMTRGFDAEERLVSLFVLDERRYPWRLVITDGTPPADVTEREDQLIECIDGTRPVLADGTCDFDS